jgi:hypothetical protein
MRVLIAAVHGILTHQTDPSWPDKFSAWMYERDREVHVTVRRYWAGPFPRWNCWIKDPWLARGLASELELFLGSPGPAASPDGAPPSLWFVAHSNGAVIALLAARRLIARGYRVGGLILTGAACEADVNRNGVREALQRRQNDEGRMMNETKASGAAAASSSSSFFIPHSSFSLGAAIAYSSADDEVLPAPVADGSGGLLRTALRRVYAALAWPYGSLGRTGWRGGMEKEEGRMKNEEGAGMPKRLLTRWYAGGHSTYFTPQHIERTFEQIYADIAQAEVEPIPAFAARGAPGAHTFSSFCILHSSFPLSFLGQLPSLPSGALETWLLSAVAVVSMALMAKKLLVRKPPIEAEFVSKAEFRVFRERVEHDLNGLRDKIDARFLGLGEKIEEMKGELLSAGERRGDSLHRRINELEAGLARVDERTLKRWNVKRDA